MVFISILGGTYERNLKKFIVNKLCLRLVRKKLLIFVMRCLRAVVNKETKIFDIIISSLSSSKCFRKLNGKTKTFFCHYFVSKTIFCEHFAILSRKNIKNMKINIRRRIIIQSTNNYESRLTFQVQR